MSVIITLATRNRPKMLAHTLRMMLARIALDDTRIFVAADDDDGPTIDELKRFCDPRLIVDISPRPDTVAAKWNAALKHPADVYQVMGDDVEIPEQGFDRLVEEAALRFPDGIGVVYGAMVNASFPGIQAITRKMADVLGYIYPEIFPYWFVDHWLCDIAQLIGRISYAPVSLIERRTGTMGLREPDFWASYFDAHQLTRRRLAHEIIRYHLDEPQWRRDILLRHYPMIEYRSRWINDNVRAMTPELVRQANPGPPDERYLRLKLMAICCLKVLVPELEYVESEAA